MLRLRRSALPILLAALCAALSGCVAIDKTDSVQPSSTGPVTLTIHACATGSPNCSGTANSGSVYDALQGSNATIDAQLLVSVRLPVASTPPETIVGTIDGGTSLTFKRDPTLESEFQTLEPAPAGERWWGWRSSSVPYGRNTK